MIVPPVFASLRVCASRAAQLALFVLNSMNSLSRIRAGKHEPSPSWLSLEKDIFPTIRAIVEPQLQCATDRAGHTCSLKRAREHQV